jgi:post-segregation antitoxin (ccd killing protein)
VNGGQLEDADVAPDAAPAGSARVASTMDDNVPPSCLVPRSAGPGPLALQRAPWTPIRRRGLEPLRWLGALARTRAGVYNRRMPRMQVYLPDDLYTAVKERDLPASELLQAAVRAELRRLELLAEADRYLEELLEEVGEPTDAQLADADRLAARIASRGGRKAG